MDQQPTFKSLHELAAEREAERRELAKKARAEVEAWNREHAEKLHHEQEQRAAQREQNKLELLRQFARQQFAGSDEAFAQAWDANLRQHYLDLVATERLSMKSVGTAVLGYKSTFNL
jgi:hypothetical protein